MPCHRGLQGTFHARADLPQPSEFQGMFAMETWFLAATKAKKSLPRQNEICFSKIQLTLPHFCARIDLSRKKNISLLQKV